MRRLIALTFAAAAVALVATPGFAAEPVSMLAKADPQPAADRLQPGLAVTYYWAVFNETDEIVEWAKYKDGKEGPPIPRLDYFVGDGEVLTSGRVDEVGADIRGFIRFPTAGTYVMAMQSNDGVDLKIGGKQIILDPDVHADRYSDLVPVEISEPGWYPLHLLYFEKRITSTLELYWNPPGGDDDMELVPAEAFAHLPEDTG